MSKLIILLCSILVILLSYTFFVPINGIEVGDTVPYISFLNQFHAINKDKPTICVYEPDDNLITKRYNTTKLSEKAINEWVYGLKERTDGEWDVNVIVTSSTENHIKPSRNNCDIHMRFSMYDIKEPKTAGKTMFMFNFGQLKSVKNIIVYTYFLDLQTDNKTYIAVPRNDKIIVDILEHEIGHAFGLAHYNNIADTIPTSYNIELSHKSIMYHSVGRIPDHMVRIQELDYNAIIQRYGEDGWGGGIRDVTKYYELP